LLRGKEGFGAESTGTEAFFHADDLTAGKTIGGSSKEGMAGCEACASARGGGGGGERWIGLEFEGADRGVL